MLQLKTTRQSTLKLFHLLLFGILMLGFSTANAQLSWEKFTGKVPSNFVKGGEENKQDIPICQCEYKGATHPGKVVVNKCHIGWGGIEVLSDNFKILVNNGAPISWIEVKDGKLPTGAVIGGIEGGQNFYVGKAYRAQDQSSHPGKIFVVNGKMICNYSWGGKEIVEKEKFSVLITEEQKPSNPTATSINPDVAYTIESVGKAGQNPFLESSGSNLVLMAQKPNNANVHQQFTFIPVEGGSFKIMNGNERYLTYQEGIKKLSLEPKGSYGKQNFGVTFTTDGTVKISVSAGIGLPIDLTLKEDKLVMEKAAGGYTLKNQRFKLYATNESTAIPTPTKDFEPNKLFYYTIESREKPGTVMHIDIMQPEPRAQLRLYDNQNQPWQRFAFIPDGKGYYYIETAMMPELVVAGFEDGQNIELNQKRDGVDKYRFKLKEAANGYVAFESAIAPNVYLGLPDPNANIPDRSFSNDYSLVLRNGFSPDRALFKLNRTNNPVSPTTASIGYFNEGGYVARFYITYEVFGKTVSLSSGDMPLKAPRGEFSVPMNARNIRVWGMAANWNPLDIGTNWGVSWSKIFEKNYATPIDICFKTYNTALNPLYNQDCEPWVPIINGNVHVQNQTGGEIYASYCTDLGWSIANMTGGMVLGLLLENTQKPDPNYVRLLAFCLATDIKLPDAAFFIFKQVAFNIPQGQSKLVVHTNALETLKSLFDFVDSPEESVLQVGIDNIERSDDFKTKNLEYNPIIAAGGIFGAKTLNLLIFDKNYTKYWLVASGIDESWIIKGDYAVKSKSGSLSIEDPYSTKYPSIPLPK